MKKVKLFKAAFYMCVLILASSCAKDAVQPAETIGYVDKDKLQRMEKFISIVWATPPEKVIYNVSKQEFTFGENGEILMSREKVEGYYDRANEYKLVHEK